NSLSALTLPYLLILPRSFRSKSTIIKFSALFFSLRLNCNNCISSVCVLQPLLAVPFIGFAVILPFFTRKKSSGDKEIIMFSPELIKAEYFEDWLKISLLNKQIRDP